MAVPGGKARRKHGADKGQNDVEQSAVQRGSARNMHTEMSAQQKQYRQGYHKAEHGQYQKLLSFIKLY